MLLLPKQSTEQRGGRSLHTVARYPTDLGHNFVLAHARHNNSKSDYLVAEPHLQSWVQLNQERADELAECLRDANLSHDSSASLRISEWTYEQVEKARGQKCG